MTLATLVRDDLVQNGQNAALFALLGPYAWGVALLALAVLVWVWRQPPTLYHHALLWTTPLLCSPHLGFYDLMLLALPLSFLAPVLRRDRLALSAVAFVWLSQLAFLARLGSLAAMLAPTFVFIVCTRRALRTASVVDWPATPEHWTAGLDRLHPSVRKA